MVAKRSKLAHDPLDRRHWQEDVNRRTRWNIRHIADMRQRLAEWECDARAEARQTDGYCRSCYYVKSGGIAGQAFTKNRCRMCFEVQVYATTAQDKVCGACSK